LRKHFDNEQIVDLLVAIAHYNGIVRLLSALQVDVEPEYLPYLEKFPLPT
jgi:alkylhydroperoxidase family enzyme